MHIFDSGDQGTNKVLFVISIVMISVKTYVLLFGFWLNDKRQHGELKRPRMKPDKVKSSVLERKRRWIKVNKTESPVLEVKQGDEAV